MLKGKGDVQAVASGSKQSRFRALNGKLDMMIESASRSKPVAWFPVALDNMVTHPTGIAWAGARIGQSHLYVVQIEGTEEEIAGKDKKIRKGSVLFL